MMMSNVFKKLPSAIAIVLIIAMILYPSFLVWDYMTHKDTREYSLIELEDGVYAYYQVVVSNVPSHNYDIITLNVNGNILTLKGNVNIHHSEECTLIWTDTNVNYGDTIDVYIPIDSVTFLSTSYSR